MAKQEKKAEVFQISDKIKKEGYGAKIDGQMLVVIAREYGQTVDLETGNRHYGVRKEAQVVVDKQPTEKPYFENLSVKQQFELATAGVIVLSDEQNKNLKKALSNA